MISQWWKHCSFKYICLSVTFLWQTGWVDHTNLCRQPAGSRCRQSTARSACRPGSSSIWARFQRWLSSVVWTWQLSRRRHEALHRSPSAARWRWPLRADTSVGNTRRINTRGSAAGNTRSPTAQHLFSTLYLQSKLVEEVIDEIFDEVEDAHVQVLSCDVVEDDGSSWRRQLVPEPEEQLVAVDGHFKRQESQHQEVVLHRWGQTGHVIILLLHIICSVTTYNSE